MSGFGEHAAFIIAAYAAAALVVLALVGWVVLDGRALRRHLADLEARGIRRRAARSTGDPAP